MITSVRFSFGLRDCWVGAYWVTYRRRGWPGTELKDLVKLATDLWCCPLPFCKFYVRWAHCKATPEELVAMDLTREIV